jgi:hypothetical protein
MTLNGKNTNPFGKLIRYLFTDSNINGLSGGTRVTMRFKAVQGRVRFKAVQGGTSAGQGGSRRFKAECGTSAGRRSRAKSMLCYCGVPKNISLGT